MRINLAYEGAAGEVIDEVVKLKQSGENVYESEILEKLAEKIEAVDVDGVRAEEKQKEQEVISMAESSVNSEDEEESGWASKDGIKAARNLRGESSVDEMLGSKGKANVPKSLGDARVGVVGDERKVLDGVAGAVDVAESLGGTSNVARQNADKTEKEYIKSQGSDELKAFPFDEYEDTEENREAFAMLDKLGLGGSDADKYWAFQHAQYIKQKNALAVLAYGNKNFKDTSEYKTHKGRMDIIEQRAREAGYDLSNDDDWITGLSTTAASITFGRGKLINSFLATVGLKWLDNDANHKKDVGNLIINFSSYKNANGEEAPYDLCYTAAMAANEEKSSLKAEDFLSGGKIKTSVVIDLIKKWIFGSSDTEAGKKKMLEAGFYPVI